MINMEDIGQDYIDQARSAKSNNNNRLAFERYVWYFTKCPDKRTVYFNEFRQFMMGYNIHLWTFATRDEFFYTLGRVLIIYPNNPYFTIDLGRYLMKRKDFIDANQVFTISYNCNLDIVEPLICLCMLKQRIFHNFWKLNDRRLNEAYRTAIRNSIAAGKDNVISVNAEIGLLSIYAQECRPRSITICQEYSQITNEIINENNELSDVIVIHKKAKNLMQSDFQYKPTLALFDTFNTALLKTEMLDAIYNVRKYVVARDGRIIPAKAEYFVVGCQCNSIHSHHQLVELIKRNLKISNVPVHGLFPYKSNHKDYDLNRHTDLRYLTTVQKLFDISFNDVFDMEEKLTNSQSYRASLNCEMDGEINIIVGWFNLYLDNDIMVTTNPMCDDRIDSISQAVFFDVIPKKVMRGQEVIYNFTSRRGEISLHLGCSVVKISPKVIRFLNDEAYIQSIVDSVPDVQAFLESTVSIRDVRIIDLSPFPLFGMHMLKDGAAHLVCVAETENEKHFFIQVLTANDVCMSKVEILEGEQWPICERMDEFNVIFSNIINISGSYDREQMFKAMQLKQFALKPCGLFLPKKVALVAQVVSCNGIDYQNKFVNQDLCPIRINDQVSRYQNLVYNNIHIENFEYTALTDAVVVGHLRESWETQVSLEKVSVPVIRDGEANAIFCWCSIQIFESPEEVPFNRFGSFAGSFVFIVEPRKQLRLSEEITIVRNEDLNGMIKLRLISERGL